MLTEAFLYDCIRIDRYFHEFLSLLCVSITFGIYITVDPFCIRNTVKIISGGARNTIAVSVSCALHMVVARRPLRC